MGVAGSGKTTLGERLASTLGWPFAEGDRFHPTANLAKMSAGVPLDDADRRPWLRALADWIATRAAAGEPAVVACSALKRGYRDVLRSGADDVAFLHLDGSAALLAERLGARKGHFFPADLLASQCATLQPLAPDERGATIDAALDLDRQIDAALRSLARG
jgi:gluconokinase